MEMLCVTRRASAWEAWNSALLLRSIILLDMSSPSGSHHIQTDRHKSLSHCQLGFPSLYLHAAWTVVVSPHLPGRGSNLACYASHEIWVMSDRQADTTDRTEPSATATSTGVSIHLFLYMHHHHEQQRFHHIFRVWDPIFHAMPSVTWNFGHGRSCLPSWNTSAKPPAAANRSFLNFFKPLSGWGPASTSSQSLSRRPMLFGNNENWKSPEAEDMEHKHSNSNAIKHKWSTRPYALP